MHLWEEKKQSKKRGLQQTSLDLCFFYRGTMGGRAIFWLCTVTDIWEILTFLKKNPAELLLALIFLMTKKSMMENNLMTKRKSLHHKCFKLQKLRTFLFFFAVVSEQILEILIKLKITAALVTKNVWVTGGYKKKRTVENQSTEKRNRQIKNAHICQILSGRPGDWRKKTNKPDKPAGDKSQQSGEKYKRHPGGDDCTSMNSEKKEGMSII